MPSTPDTSSSASFAAGNAGPPGGSEARARWTLRLLGGFELSDGEQRYTRLASRPVVALLARLTLWPYRNHPREELVETLWPGVEPEVSRNRLRQALSVLKAVLEPPSDSPSPVLLADRYDVRLVRGAIDCDVVAFDREARLGRVDAALAYYRGELLPGYFDEWVLDERMRLQAVHERLSARVQAVSAAPIAAALARDEPRFEAAARPVVQRAALPVYLTRHFLAVPARAAWMRELADHRVLTLLGPGGSGKTRLAVELAHALQSQQHDAEQRASDTESIGEPIDAVAFVSLVACETRAQALDAIASALGVYAQTGELIDELMLALQERRLLLVLDNFEQLAVSTCDVVTRFAAALPRLRILVTSRRALGIDGERALLVHALELPGADLPLVQALGNPAVALFVDRARQVRAEFHLNEGNRRAVSDLVRALEGLPLAIELAASRIRSLSPARILELLADRDTASPHLELLARGGPRAASGTRHASMERVIAWSWQQLSSDEVILLQALCVFSGGCTAQAAASVRGLSPLQAALHLDALVASSMLRASEARGDMRFAMYEPIREFGLMQVRQGEPGALARLRAAHRGWLLEWAESLPTTPSLPALRAELPNVSVALHSALADADAASAVRTVLALCRVQEELLLGPGALADLQQAVIRCEDAELQSRGHTQLGQLLFAAARGDEARRHAQLGLDQASGEPGVRAGALHVKARLHWLSFGYAPWMDAALDEAETLARAAQDGAVIARVHVLRAAIAYSHRGDMVQGEALYRAALGWWQRLGNQHAINGGRYFVSLIAHEAGRHEEAIERADEVIRSARELDDGRRVSQALQVRGKAQAALRRWQDATASFRDSIRLAWDAMALVELARSLRDLPPALAHLHQGESAVALQAFAARFWHERIGRIDPFDTRQERRVRRLSAGRLTSLQREAARRRGFELGVADAVKLALHDESAP